MVGGRTPYRGNQISALVANNLNLTAFMFKSIECCFKAYDIRHVTSTSVLQYQHQWELEQKKADDLEAPKIDKNNSVNSMKNIVLHLKLMREVKGTPLAYVV